MKPFFHAVGMTLGVLFLIPTLIGAFALLVAVMRRNGIPEQAYENVLFPFGFTLSALGLADMTKAGGDPDVRRALGFAVFACAAFMLFVSGKAYLDGSTTLAFSLLAVVIGWVSLGKALFESA